jgi:hypothetical protein
VDFDITQLLLLAASIQSMLWALLLENRNRGFAIALVVAACMEFSIAFIGPAWLAMPWFMRLSSHPVTWIATGASVWVSGLLIRRRPDPTV